MTEDAGVFGEGDEVVVLNGEFKGHYGIVDGFDETLGQYVVNIKDGNHGLWPFDLDELAGLDELEDEEEEYDDEADTPEFGMSPEDFATHLEFLIERCLDRVPTVSPKDVFFGFQEFEGKTPDEILFALLRKLEDSMAHLAQTHIMVSRIGVALSRLDSEVR